MFGLKDILFSDDLDGSTGISDDVNLLNEESSDEVIPEKEEEIDEEVENEEVDEEKEIEEEENKEPRELMPHERPSFTDLKNAYPDLFKKFPSMKDVIFRERAYTEVFNTVEDAKIASEDSIALQTAREDIFNGDGSKFLSSIKEADDKALLKFSQNVLPALFKVSPEAHWAAATPLLENIVRGFARSAKDDENVKNAALLMSEFLFGEDGKDVVEGKKTFVVKPEAKSEDPERKRFETDRISTFTGEVSSSSKNSIKELITEKNKDGKSKLDPDEVFSEWMKNTMVEKISSEIDAQIAADTSHMKYMEGLWKKAKASGYTSEWKTRITSAYLARARQLVPAIRARLVSEALGTTSRSSGRMKKVAEKIRSRVEGNGSGRASRGGGGNVDSKRIDYNKTSDEDILNDNITLKG